MKSQPESLGITGRKEPKGVQDNIKDLLIEFVGAAILGTLSYLVLRLFPNLDDNLTLVIVAIIAITALVILRLTVPRFKQLLQWSKQFSKELLDKARAVFAFLRDRIGNLRACLQGELEQCRNELQTEREKLNREQEKNNEATITLVALSQDVLSLCDERIEQANELDWSSAIAVGQRADRCAKAILCHHVTKVIYYDPKYPASWMDGEIAELTRKFFVDRWFIEKDAQQLRDWINQVVGEKQACKSLIVFAQDIAPDTVIEVPNETCLLRKYLNAGGRVVWRGDVPFWYQGKSSRAKDEWGLQGPHKILGIDYTNYNFAHKSSRKFGGQIWDQDLPIQITPAGYDIDLSYPTKHIRIRPIPCENVSVPYLLIQPDTITPGPTNDGDLTLCWKKNFNPRFRHSGFMQYITGEFLPNEVNDYFFSFAVSGWPLWFE